MIKIAFKNPNTYLVIGIDALLFYGSYWAAHWLRFEELSGQPLAFFTSTVWLVVALKLVVFAAFGLQAGMWRYTSVPDLINILKAAAASFVFILFALIYLYYPNFVGKISRSVFIIDMILSSGLIAVFRLSIRLLYSRIGATPSPSDILAVAVPFFGGKGIDDGRGITALIYGVGARGETLYRSIQQQAEKQLEQYRIAGFIDDDRARQGASLHGLPILGAIDHLATIVPRFGVKELLVAKRLDREALEKTMRIAKQLALTVRVIPGYFDEGREPINTDSLRAIQIEDLLFRDTATVDVSIIKSGLRNRTALVTGAGGSIGSELVTQVALFEPSKIIAVDRSEHFLYELENTLHRHGIPDEVEVICRCADVTDMAAMERIFTTYRPATVFHAAANKHVPMMEKNRDAAVLNNVGGMKVMAQLAEKHQVQRFVLISTDKAVAPTNIMGATKRLCELYLLEKSKCSTTRFMAVRFGNVLGSNGSVVPYFMRQIEGRGPVTVTHPDVDRYFMTIHEAVLLILQATAIGSGGELFVLDMGNPVKIVDLAEKMIQLAGFTPYKDIDIVFTGLRPGEKLNEELYGDTERLEPTTHPKVRKVWSPASADSDFFTLIDQWLSRAGNEPDRVADEIISWLAADRGNEKPDSQVIVFPTGRKGKSA
jgi:FlaA1/EpsC-like NDP-sugar epimerase